MSPPGNSQLQCTHLRCAEATAKPVTLVSVCCANESSPVHHLCMVLRLGISQPASFALFCIMWFLEVEGGQAHNAPGPTSPGL